MVPRKRISPLPRCCVPGCVDRDSKRHRFPKRFPEVFKQWVEIIKPRNYEKMSLDEISKKYFVCKMHFHPVDIVPGNRGLKVYAVPCLNLPGQALPEDMDVSTPISSSTNAGLCKPTGPNGTQGTSPPGNSKLPYMVDPALPINDFLEMLARNTSIKRVLHYESTAIKEEENVIANEAGFSDFRTANNFQENEYEYIKIELEDLHSEFEIKNEDDINESGEEQEIDLEYHVNNGGEGREIREEYDVNKSGEESDIEVEYHVNKSGQRRQIRVEYDINTSGEEQETEVEYHVNKSGEEREIEDILPKFHIISQFHINKNGKAREIGEEYDLNKSGEEQEIDVENHFNQSGEDSDIEVEYHVGKSGQGRKIREEYDLNKSGKEREIEVEYHVNKSREEREIEDILPKFNIISQFHINKNGKAREIAEEYDVHKSGEVREIDVEYHFNKSGEESDIEEVHVDKSGQGRKIWEEYDLNKSGKEQEIEVEYHVNKSGKERKIVDILPKFHIISQFHVDKNGKVREIGDEDEDDINESGGESKEEQELEEKYDINKSEIEDILPKFHIDKNQKAREIKLPTCISTPVLNSRYKEYQCDKCEMSYSTISRLRNHDKIFHGKPISEIISSFICNHCETNFESKEYLVEHLNTHTRTTLSDIYGSKQRFCFRKNLNEHEEIHSDNNSFKCGECEMNFITKKDLDKHILIHYKWLSCRNDKPYKCEKRFEANTGLDEHMLTHTRPVKRKYSEVREV